jgi:hypothetical protein
MSTSQGKDFHRQLNPRKFNRTECQNQLVHDISQVTMFKGKAPVSCTCISTFLQGSFVDSCRHLFCAAALQFAHVVDLK